MPKSNRRRTTHRKRTSQRKRKNAKRGGAPLGHGRLRPFKSSTSNYFRPISEESDNKSLYLHLILQDDLGYYFNIFNNGEKNLINPETNVPFGGTTIVDPYGNYTPDDIVLPDVKYQFNTPIQLQRNETLTTGKLRGFLSHTFANVEYLRFVEPETYENWGEITNPVYALRGNTVHGDEEWGTTGLPNEIVGIPYGTSNGWRSQPNNQPLYRANRRLANVFMPVL